MACNRGEILYNFEATYRHVAIWNAANNDWSFQYGVKSANALLGRFYLSTDLNNIAIRQLQKSQYLTALTSIQCQHGFEFIPRQAIAKPTAAWKSTLDQMVYCTMGTPQLLFLVRIISVLIVIVQLLVLRYSMSELN